MASRPSATLLTSLLARLGSSLEQSHQIWALDEGHDHIGNAGVFTGIMNGANMGMPDAGRRTDLTQEALHGQPGILPYRFQARHLECYLAIQVRIVGPIYCPHAA